MRRPASQRWPPVLKLPLGSNREIGSFFPLPQAVSEQEPLRSCQGVGQRRYQRCEVTAPTTRAPVTYGVSESPVSHRRQRSYVLDWAGKTAVFLASLRSATYFSPQHIGSNDSRPGWLAGTPPTATAGSRVDDYAAAGEGRRSLASATRLGEPVVDRRTRQIPAGARPNLLQAATC